MVDFICPECKTAMEQRGERIWCPLCKETLTSIASKMAKRVRASDRNPVCHDLKTWPEYFGAIWDGRKTFDVRENDRDFKRGDLLILREWLTSQERYTGRVIEAKVTYICLLPVPGVQRFVGMQIDLFRRRDNSYPEEKGWDAQPREHK